MADSPDDLKKKIEDLLKSSSKLTSAQVKNYNAALKAAGDELDRLDEIYGDIIDKVDKISNSLNYVYESLLDSVNELSNQNKYLNIQKSALNKIADIAKNVVNIKRGETDLDTKKLAKLRQETTERIRQLQLVRDKGGLDDDEKKAIQNQIEAATKLYEGFDNVLDVNKEINKQLGLAPSLAAGLDKAFQKFGLPNLGFNEAILETKRLGQEANSVGNKSFSVWKTYTGLIGNNFKSILTTANLIQGAIGFIIDALITGDKATGDLAKDFNVTYNEAANIREELIQIGNLSGNVALNARALQESMVAVGKALGSNAMLNQADLETFTELREMAGYTNEELVGIQKLTLAIGGNLKNNTKQFLGTVSALNAQNKLTINEKQLLKEVANTSAAIKLSVGGTTEGLAKAAFQAKQFGINLDQADRIAESLLNFESSIENELSAELITGKDLNLERARLLAINGDIAGASAEILQQVKGSAEFTKMNRIQQEALAKAVGMSREDLAASLIEREALNKLGEKDAASAKAKFDLLVKEKGYAAAVAEMGDEQYANQLKQQSVQERFNQSVEKLKEIFISIAEPILQIVSPFVDILLPVLSTISGVFGQIGVGLSQMSTLIKDIIIGWTIYKGITLAIAGYKSMMLGFDVAMYGIGKKDLTLQAARNLAKGEELATQIGIAAAWVIANPLLALVGAALATGIGALVYSQMKDGVIDPNKGPVISGGFGSVQLSDKDTAVFNGKQIVAGTNLGGGKSNPTSQQQDLSPLLEEMRAMRQEQAKSNSKPTIVENSMNGTKFGTSVAMNTYKIQ